jgi:zinc D-Ala-D-Ala carboxypeptidase
VHGLIYEHFTEMPESVWPSIYFKPVEIACKGTGELEINQEALDALDIFRSLIGGPVSISSAYRSIYHNSVVGGAPLSSHTHRGSNGATAFDIKLQGRDKDVIRRCGEQAGFKGFGMKYNTFVHIDMGRRREW